MSSFLQWDSTVWGEKQIFQNIFFLCKNLIVEQKTCWRSRIHCRIPGWRFSGGKKDFIWFSLHLLDLTGDLYDAVCFEFVFNTFFRFSLGPARASHRIIAVLSVPLGIPQYCSIDASSSNTRQCVQLRLLPLTEWWSFFRCFSSRITSFLKKQPYMDFSHAVIMSHDSWSFPLSSSPGWRIQKLKQGGQR